MANSLYPAFVQINYHSSFAPHVQTIPLKDWTPGAAGGDIETWAGGVVSGDSSIETLANLQEPFFPVTVLFDSFTIFTMATPTSPAIAQYSKVLTNVGTNITAAQTKAVQATWTMKTQEGGLFKLVQLDMNNGNSFAKINFAGLNAEAQALLAHLFSSTQGFAGRDGAKPSFFLQIAYTLNEKLRRSYYMN